jgi:hypothetical protein
MDWGGGRLMTINPESAGKGPFGRPIIFYPILFAPQTVPFSTRSGKEDQFGKNEKNSAPGPIGMEIVGSYCVK